MKNYLSKLNTEQYKAATSIDGMNFILAGAGSGKTAVLVARVAYMLDNGIDPKNILLLTFTNTYNGEGYKKVYSHEQRKGRIRRETIKRKGE